MTERYNGWTNKFTWICELHLENDEYTYNDIRNYIKDLKSFTKGDADMLYCLQDYLYSYVRDNLLNYELSLLETDLIEYALSEIDFWQIAENWLDM